MTIASPETHKTHDTFVADSTSVRVRIPGRTAGWTSARASLSSALPGKSVVPGKSGSLGKSRTLDTDYLAHDTRNWLTVLQVYCDLLRTSGAVASGYEKWIDELSSAVERGQGLVASLLNSVQEAHETSYRRDPVRDVIHSAGTSDRRWPVPPNATSTAASTAKPLDVSDAISRRLPLLQRLAGGNIQVEIDVQANAGKVALAESAFERILHNLVSNAIEAMPHGGHLRIALRRHNRCVEPAAKSGTSATGDRRSGRMSTKPPKKIMLKTLLLRVHDTGEGIPPENLPYIFESGISGKTAREDDGQARGFGLSIVRELIQSAGGAVRARSHPGRGCCFEIELPRI